MRTDAYWFYPMQLHRHRQMSILELFKVKKLLWFLKLDSKNSMCDAKRLYLNELCHTLIMQRYENDKNMKFWEFFESKKCFVFYNFRNRCKSRGPWCILNQLKVLAPSSQTVRHVLLNWTVPFFLRNRPFHTTMPR